MGTPKTLREALKNSLTDLLPEEAREIVAKDIEPHVIDFLAQRFSCYTLDDSTGKFAELFESITERKAG